MIWSYIGKLIFNMLVLIGIAVIHKSIRLRDVWYIRPRYPPDMIRVHRFGILPSSSFRFYYLTMDTLDVHLLVGDYDEHPHNGLSPPRYMPCSVYQETDDNKDVILHYHLFLFFITHSLA